MINWKVSPSDALFAPGVLFEEDESSSNLAKRKKGHVAPSVTSRTELSSRGAYKVLGCGRTSGNESKMV